MLMANELEKRALEATQFDPLDTAYQLADAGIINEDSRDGVGFVLMHENSALKRLLWQELGDTFRGMPWEEFTRIISDSGFQPIKEWKFPYRYGSNSESTIVYPRKLIAADLSRKLLLVADSWVEYSSLNEKVNGIGAMGYIEADDHVVGEIRSQVHASSGYEDGAWKFLLSGDEGLLTQLKAFDRDDVKFVDWKDIPIGFGDYSNLREPVPDSRDYSKKASRIRKQKRIEIASFLMEAPHEVRSFMDPTGQFSFPT